jgi:hypothetical protein
MILHKTLWLKNELLETPISIIDIINIVALLSGAAKT